jgi:hypothetical protein
MQSLQLHVTGVARSWLGNLGRKTIGSWDKLTKLFISNFNSTYKRPMSTKEVKTCTQKHNKSLRSYIQWWSIITNSEVEVFDKRAIDASMQGLRRADFIEEMGRIEPKTVAELMGMSQTDS